MKTSLWILVCLLVGTVFASEVQEPGIWEVWSSESYTMYARESFQIRYDDALIQTRRWVLVVDGAGATCDLSVLRVQGEELLYFKTDETRHEVSIPWGKGEEIIVVLSNDSSEATFEVQVQGPPHDQNPAYYSYAVNRALEAYTGGQRLRARELCRTAIMEDKNDGVAKVLLAGFLKESHSYGEALGLLQDARDDGLPAEMKTLAEAMEKELEVLRAPLPKDLQLQLNRAEKALQEDEPRAALEHCEKLLMKSGELGVSHRASVMVIKGRALMDLGRNFEAIDAFTQALNFDRSKAAQAIAYYYMGDLYLDMGNEAQAEGALSIARQHGLPSGLDLQARERLQRLNKLKGSQ